MLRNSNYLDDDALQDFLNYSLQNDKTAKVAREAVVNRHYDPNKLFLSFDESWDTAAPAEKQKPAHYVFNFITLATFEPEKPVCILNNRPYSENSIKTLLATNPVDPIERTPFSRADVTTLTWADFETAVKKSLAQQNVAKAAPTVTVTTTAPVVTAPDASVPTDATRLQQSELPNADILLSSEISDSIRQDALDSLAAISDTDENNSPGLRSAITASLETYVNFNRLKQEQSDSRFAMQFATAESTALLEKFGLFATTNHAKPASIYDLDAAIAASEQEFRKANRR